MYHISNSKEVSMRRGTTYIAFLFILALFYLSYRYPLQINSSTTSPSYSDTPFVLQFAKYALFGSVVYLGTLSALTLKLNPDLKKYHGLEFVMHLYIFTMSLIAAIISKSDYMAQTGLFFCAMLFVYLFPIKHVNGKIISNIIHFFLYLSIVFDAFQVIMYKFFDRLPALAYENSINVRFGSLWDDPNGFALMLGFLLPFYWTSKHTKKAKYLVGALIIIMLLLTQSLTGLASVVGSIILGSAMILISQKKIRKLSTLLMAIFGVAGIGYYLFTRYIFNMDWVQLFLAEKQDSISLHLNYASQVTISDVLTLVSLEPVGKFSESGFINIIINFGSLFLIIYIISGLIALGRLLKTIRDHNDARYISIYYGAFFFMIAFFIGMTNIPYDAVYPINLIYVICLIISFTKPPLVSKTH